MAGKILRLVIRLRLATCGMLMDFSEILERRKQHARH